MYPDDEHVLVVGAVEDAEVAGRRQGPADAPEEKELVAGGTVVVKCLLHISYDEQRQRLLDRLEDPNKHWKFNEADIDERALWGDYQEAYRDAVRNCTLPEAPWYVVPADRKWYRNWAVGRILLETLDATAPTYPQPILEIPRLKARLAPTRLRAGDQPLRAFRRLRRTSTAMGATDRAMIRRITGRRYLSMSGMTSPRT